MSSYYHFNAHQQHPTQATAAAVQHAHHGGRNRRAPRLSVSQNAQKQFRGVRSMKELAETSHNLSDYRMKFEATRSFELEDDLDFIPNLLTDSDRFSIASSERSSLASLSPESSPTQQPTTVAPPFSLNSTSPAFIPPSFQSHNSGLKLHQPAATRTRGNAIPIINPSTGITMASPPQSVSPARMQQHAIGRRWL
ncbi:hypothetical protein CONLIGDRAFT_708618 [Coniochaeta ligniaria NRRL 30616]|uniref:Uncharacterized protein n=1 Tax=Coniochaeta ligniaria NRRL 30616 TaxID=1408157 RepID=A0A1J7IEH7_9PEZI|nr:hypothetical protein CONLIGDRAFT_708618 [Coniochaeta ligniaria NRRL 30616]